METTPSKSQTVMLEVERITVMPGHNPRKEFQPNALFELGQSMAECSQLAPIIVNRIDGQNVLVAGERRLRAAIENKTEFIEAKVFDDLDELTALRMSLAENHKRVNLTAVEEASGMAKLIELGVSEKEAAEEFGYGVNTVRSRLKLLKLPDAVQRMITREMNPLPVHQALQLKNLPESDQIQLAKKIAPVTGPVASEAETKEIIRKAVGGELPFTEGRTPRNGDRTTTDGQTYENTGAGSSGKKPETTGKTKSKGKLKPINAAIGISGKITINEDGQAVIPKATITVKVDDKVKVMQSTNPFVLELEGTDLAAVGKLIKKAQPKTETKKTTKKKVAKKKTKK